MLLTTILIIILSIIIYPLWINKLDILTNLINIGLLTLDLFATPLHYINQNDLITINQQRIAFSYFPMGFNLKMKLNKEFNIISISGHKIPLIMSIPNQCTEIKSCNVLIYFHGGGFVIGSPKIFMPITTRIADKTGFIVFSIDYRKAPEYKFPSGPLDCIEATKYIYYNINEFTNLANINNLSIAGDSAGANLVSIVTNELISLNIIKFSILIYPVITHGGHITTFSKSRLLYANAPILTANKIEWYTQMYFNDITDLIPNIHPLACGLCFDKINDINNETIKNYFPQIHIITAEIDPLNSEGELYYNYMLSIENKLNLKNKVTLTQYNNTIHGFFGISFLPHGLKAVDDISHLLINYFK